MLYKNILHLIGNTPIIKLNTLSGIRNNNIFAKLESYNPTGSLKDRPALLMIEDAEEKGILEPGGTIIESTSGNLGVSLALIGAMKGYKVICIVDPKTPEPSILSMKAFGAQLIMVDVRDADGSYQKNRIEKAKEIHKKIPKSFIPNQYSNPNNPLSHSIATAKEILNDLGKNIDFLVCSVSTCGHICGIARTLKEQVRKVKIIAVEPEGSVIFGGIPKPYAQTGIGLSFIPENADMELIDDYFKVSDKDAFETTKKLIKEEGLMIGISSGSAAYAALQISNINESKNIVCVFPDRGERYLNKLIKTEFVEEPLLEIAIHEHRPNNYAH